RISPLERSRVKPHSVVAGRTLHPWIVQRIVPGGAVPQGVELAAAEFDVRLQPVVEPIVQPRIDSGFAKRCVVFKAGKAAVGRQIALDSAGRDVAKSTAFAVLPIQGVTKVPASLLAIVAAVEVVAIAGKRRGV